MALAAAPAKADEERAAAFVRDIADRAVAELTDTSLARDERERRFRELFTSKVDLETVGRLVLARYWRVADEAQQKEFLDLFEDVTVLTWAGRFSEYSGETMQVRQVRPDGDTGVFVETRIDQVDGDPVSVVWRLRENNGEYRVIDLVVEGVSMVITLRSEYASVIQRGGRDVEALLSALRSQRERLSGGS